MKKVTLFAAAAFVVASMASCKKNYTCECTNGNAAYAPIKAEYTKVKKKDAEASCSTLNSAWSYAGYSCSLK